MHRPGTIYRAKKKVCCAIRKEYPSRYQILYYRHIKAQTYFRIPNRENTFRHGTHLTDYISSCNITNARERLILTSTGRYQGTKQAAAFENTICHFVNLSYNMNYPNSPPPGRRIEIARIINERGRIISYATLFPYK